MATARLDLAAIERSLRAVQRDFARINIQLKVRRDPMGEEIVGRMLAGYELVDGYLAKGIDLFGYGNSKLWLELNTMVLCGSDEARRRDVAAHIAATERRFYDEHGGGIGSIVDWHARHRRESPWLKAAGVYVRVLSEPQLFIEGNHRTGALVMSYLLARDGKPPFVLSVDNAVAYFDPSSVIKHTRKTTFALLVQIPRIKKTFAAFLKAQSDRRLLHASAPKRQQALATVREATP